LFGLFGSSGSFGSFGLFGSSGLFGAQVFDETKDDFASLVCLA